MDHVKQHQSTVTPSGSSTTTGAHSSRSASKSQRNFLVRWTLNFSALFRNVLSTPGLLANWKKSWNAPTERKDIKNNTYTNKHPQFGKCITIYMLIDKDQSLITASIQPFNPFLFHTVMYFYMKHQAMKRAADEFTVTPAAPQSFTRPGHRGLRRLDITGSFSNLSLFTIIAVTFIMLLFKRIRD